MDKKKNTLTEGDVLKALYHMYCAAAYKGSVTMSSETAIGLYNFFHAQKEEINQLKETLSATIAGQESMQKYLVEQKAEIERLNKENEHFADIGKMYSEIKAEAIKEFAEKTNKMITQIYNKHIFGNNDLNDEEKDAIINFSDDVVSGFANLVKETVGDV